jgi:hypothetical protein
VTWLPNCPPGQVTEVDIFILSSPTRVSGWPGKTGTGTKLIGSYKLPNGDTVWVVYWEINLPDFSRAMPPGAVHRFYKGKTKDDLKSAHLRAIAFADEPDGSRTMYDFAVAYKRKSSNET